jgi:hypothetical protein
MKTSDGAFHQCYNGRAIVDSTAQVIVTAEISDEAPDARLLQGSLDQLAENLTSIDAQLPAGAALLGDAGYFSEHNIQITEGHRLDAPGPGPVQALRAPCARAARTGPQERHGQATDGAQAGQERRRRALRKTEDDRGARLRADANRPGRPPAQAARQARRPCPMALPMRRPQPAENCTETAGWPSSLPDEDSQGASAQAPPPSHDHPPTQYRHPAAHPAESTAGPPAR